MHLSSFYHHVFSNIVALTLSAIKLTLCHDWRSGEGSDDQSWCGWDLKLSWWLSPERQESRGIYCRTVGDEDEKQSKRGLDTILCGERGGETMGDVHTFLIPDDAILLSWSCNRYSESKHTRNKRPFGSRRPREADCSTLWGLGVVRGTMMKQSRSIRDEPGFWMNLWCLDPLMFTVSEFQSVQGLDWFFPWI